MDNNIDFEKDGFVSIWVGNFNSQNEFDLFFKEHIGEDANISEPLNNFAKTIGIGFYDHDFQEAEFFGEDLLPITEILSPFSYSSSFIGSAVESANEKQIEKANTVILLFDYKYEVETKTSLSPINFIGSFTYDKNSQPFSEIG